VPYGKLDDSAALARQSDRARAAMREGGAGVWVVEVDADLVFHSPMFRGVTFVVDRGGVPVRGLAHVARSLWKRVKDDSVEEPLAALHRFRVEHGLDLLGDLPEFIIRRAEERLIEEPWTYWRYPLGASRRREPRVYAPPSVADPPPIADPALQVKAPAGGPPGPDPSG
jgi:hypothetical protein